MHVTKEDIEAYLSEVKKGIENGRCRIEMNDRRKANVALRWKYVIDDDKTYEILCNLTAMDFSKILHNEHKGYEHELLYVFGKDINLLERTGHHKKRVSLYIKINKLEDCSVIVISFHEQKFPMSYYFQ